MKHKSIIMKFFELIGMDYAAWSCRRLHTPVDKNALVLEVGSGSSPYFRSNVLLDAFESTQERHWTPLIQDRPTVLGFGENLPFKDKSFDFIIASHVLEHSTDPGQFLNELMRVGKAGYIEVPHAFMERITAYFDHRLELLIEDGIWKKKDWNVDIQLQRFFNNMPNEVFSKYLISKKPFQLHVCLYWENTIQYEIMNPEVNLDWEPPTSTASGTYKTLPLMAKLKLVVLKITRMIFSQRARNRNLDILGLIRCPVCFSEIRMKNEQGVICCQNCKNQYKYSGNFIDFISKHK